MSETPTGGGSAFWAARGVRIEPEPAAEEPEYEDEAEGEDAADAEGAGGGGGELSAIPAQASDPTVVAEAAEVAPEDVTEVAEVVAGEQAEAGDSSEPAILVDSPDPVMTADSDVPAAADDADSAALGSTPNVPVADAAAEREPDVDPEPELEFETAAAAAAETAPSDSDAESTSESTSGSDAGSVPAGPGSDLVPASASAPALGPDSGSAFPFIPTQATFDEVEPQLGEPVDGLVALNETLIDAARAKAEREAKAAEPVWQLTDDNLAALPDLRTCLEAILLVVDEPVTEVMLAQIVERPTEQVAAALRALSAEYTSQGRGFDLREVGIGDGSLVTQTGWRFYTRAECAPVVERYIRDGQQSKLTQAALETLAVVAYRQPVSRSKVSAIRGVNCDGVMRTLLARGLVEECGTEYETGALLYRTTGYFLERMGLKGLEELPDLAPLLPSAADMEDEV